MSSGFTLVSRIGIASIAKIIKYIESNEQYINESRDISRRVSSIALKIDAKRQVSFDNLNRMKLYASYVILVTRIKFRSELSRIVNVPGSFSLVDLSFYAYFIDRHIRINISGAMKESSHYSYICPSSLAARINVKISGRSSSINPKCNEWCEVCARCIPAILITCTSRDVEVT